MRKRDKNKKSSFLLLSLSAIAVYSENDAAAADLLFLQLTFCVWKPQGVGRKGKDRASDRNCRLCHSLSLDDVIMRTRSLARTQTPLFALFVCLFIFLWFFFSFSSFP